MQQLYVSHAEQRRMHGVESYAQASRFLSEIPPELVEEVRPKINVQRAGVSRSGSGRPASAPPGSGVTLGQRVRHGKFGEGVILNYEGAGSHARVQVNFEAVGAKWLVMSYANLELM
jgi:DNA helicase-2/ATP-dependent DNA helicase PcrA